jgi:peptidoglycan/LPS O-acetylase OafA/YrhL
MPDAVPAPRLRHLPGLDGLRGLAVAAVVAYHLDVPGAGGGFLGVSLFFTLSGYLITSLLLGEHEATGRIGLRAFWGRRARRLLPAALACLGAVVVVGQGLGGGVGLAGDVRAAVLDVANWRFLLARRSYASLFDAPSPVLHFWSLAIEEQFYLVYPVLAALALRRGRRWLATGLVVASAASVGAQLLAGGRFDLVYYGTHTRAGELLGGCLLALALPPATAAALGRRARARLGAAGLVGLVGLAALWSLTGLGDAWLVGGGLVAVAAVNALAVAGATAGPVARVLAARPLVAVGRISYGLYLAHWPVVVWLDHDRTGLSGVPLAAVRLAVSVAVAVASHRLLESRFRDPRRIPAGTARLAAVTTVAVVLVATVGVTARAVRPSAALLAGFDEVAEASVGPAAEPATSASPVPATAATTSVTVVTATTGATTAGATAATTAATTAVSSTAPPPPPPPTVWLVGDSVPYLLGRSLAPTSFGVRWIDLGIPSCDGARGNPRMRLGIGVELTEPEACGHWDADWTRVAGAAPPDHVLVMLGATTVVDRWIGGRWQSPCDPDFAAWYRPELDARLSWLVATTAARVHVVLPAPADTAAIGVVPGDAGARAACLAAMYRDAARAQPAARVDVVDLAAFVCPPPTGACRPLRADGLHYQDAAATEVAQWLVEAAGLTARAPTGVTGAGEHRAAGPS